MPSRCLVSVCPRWASVREGHGDWRYDEFRVTDAGHLVHEIEWWAAGEAGRWLIEAGDVRLEWKAVARDV